MEAETKPRDLEDRTFRFAELVRAFVKQLPRTIGNAETFGSWCAPQIRSPLIGSTRMRQLSKKDFLMRVKICRKEAKESRLFLRLVDADLTKATSAARDQLAAEARELTLIFSSIISKSG